MRYDLVLVRRFVTKVIHDVLPAALASLIGGFLLTHYGFGRPSDPLAVQAAPASVQMMDLLRDEHALVVNYLQAQIANEKKQALAATGNRAAAEQNAAAAEPAAAAPQPQVMAIAASKTAGARGKASVVGASLPPLVIAQTPPSDTAEPAVRNDDVFFPKAIKDRVVAATQRAVAVIGGIPSWFGAIGDRIGGERDIPRPPVDLVSTS